MTKIHVVSCMITKLHPTLRTGVTSSICYSISVVEHRVSSKLATAPVFLVLLDIKKVVTTNIHQRSRTCNIFIPAWGSIWSLRLFPVIKITFDSSEHARCEKIVNVFVLHLFLRMQAKKAQKTPPNGAPWHTGWYKWSGISCVYL